MKRRLDSVIRSGYVEAIDIVESDLEAVVKMLEITDAPQSQMARDRIYSRLEDFQTARARTATADTIREDIRTLERLAEALDPERLAERVRPALDSLDTLRETNPVLHRRLEWTAPRNRLHDRFVSLQDAEETIYAVGREICERISTVKEEFTTEDGRGRPADLSGRKFASSLYDIWVEFTDRGTSRQNAPDRQKDPFGDFVEAAGKLIDPDFKGHHLAREIHEARR